MLQLVLTQQVVQNIMVMMLTDVMVFAKLDINIFRRGVFW